MENILGNETYTPSSEINKVKEFYFKVNQDSRTPILELVENDTPFKSYLKLQKQDKITGKLVTYSNAEFELYRLNEETSNWEKIKCKVGNKYFDTWKTDSTGSVVTETKVEAGILKLKETKVPVGFTELDEELVFEVNNNNETLEYDDDYDAWITVVAKNTQPKGTLKLTKKVNLREDVDISLIDEIDFTKIAFEITAEEDIIDYSDGSIVYSKGTVIGKYNLNSDATLTIDNIWMGKYSLKEVATIDGAVLDNTKYEVIFEQKDTTTKEYVINLNIENQTTLIEISKKAITGENEIEGATLSISDEDDNCIDTWVSGGKTHKIEGLTAGKIYTLREEIAPNGFLKATDIKFKVENTGEIQKVTMIDEPIIPDVDIEKTGIIQTTANEEIRYNFHIKNTGNVALSNFTWYDYLPTDYVKMQKLITGTYNQDLNYNVYYKTNLNDYRLLAENLNTQVNNYIDFSNIALEDGEVITEFKADFGTVDVGFESVVNPYIFVKVHNDVKNDDTFTNKTRIEGYNKGYLVWDEDDHTTKVYKKKFDLKKLPRTGF